MAEEGREFDFPWFPFWAKDFLNSRTVRLMCPEEVGIYTLLLAHEWMDGPIGDDAGEWSILTQGADPTDVQRVLERCFTLTDLGWVNERLEEVRDEQIEKRMQKVRAGKASAKSRSHKKKERRSNARSTDAQRTYQRSTNEPDTDTEPEDSTSSSLRSSDGQSPDVDNSENVDNPGAVWAPLIREHMWQGDEKPKHSPDGWNMSRAINCAKCLASEVGAEELAGAIRMYRGPPCSLAAWYKRGNRGTLNELIGKWRRSEADTVTPISEILGGTGTDG